MKKTIVINLFGGSGLGKSTTAAGLFYHMKLLGVDVELVREYVLRLGHGMALNLVPMISLTYLVNNLKKNLDFITK